MPVDEEKKAEAQQRVVGLAKKLALLFGPLEAAGLLLRPAIALLKLDLEPHDAAAYLTDLVELVEVDTLPPAMGSA